MGLCLLLGIPSLSASLYPKQTPWWELAGIAVGAILVVIGLLLFIAPFFGDWRRRKRTGERRGVVRETENSKVTTWADGQQEAVVTPKAGMAVGTADTPGVKTEEDSQASPIVVQAPPPPDRRDRLRAKLNLAYQKGQRLLLLPREMGFAEDAQAWSKETFNLIEESLGPAEATLFAYSWTPLPGSEYEWGLNHGHTIRLQHLEGIISRLNGLSIQEDWQP